MISEKLTEAVSDHPGEREYQITPVDKENFSSFGIHTTRHNYHLHPMFQLDALKELSHYLMERRLCRFIGSNVDFGSAFDHQDKHLGGKSLDQFYEQIEEPKSWIALYNVQAHPEYDRLLKEIMAKFRHLVEHEQKNIFNVAGFIFISAPPSVTPFHIDRENNFWMQIKGRKALTVFDHNDRNLVSSEAVEQFILNQSLEKVRYKEEFKPYGHTFLTQPGDGVYFPATSPHMTETTTEWVTPGDGVSVSIGVVFYTEETRRQARIYQCNNVLRKFGINPNPPGASTLGDAVKSRVGYLSALAKTRLRGYKAPTGSY